MQKLLIILFLIIGYFSYSQQEKGNRIEYVQVIPKILDKSTDCSYLDQYIYKDLTVTVAENPSDHDAFKVQLNNVTIQDWTIFGSDIVELDNTLIYHSETKRDYYLLFARSYISMEWFEVFHVENEKVKSLGRYELQDDDADKYYKSPEHKYIDRYEHNKIILYTENNKLHIVETTSAGKEVLEYFGEAGYVEEITEADGNISLSAIADGGFNDGLKTTNTYNLNDDDSEEEFTIDWIARSITSVNTAAKELLEIDNSFIHFSGDTLIIVEKETDISSPYIMREYHYHFYYSPSGNINVDKIVLKVDDKRQEDCGSYSVIFPKRFAILYGDQYLKRGLIDWNKPRLFTLKQLEDHFSASTPIFISCERMLRPYDLWFTLQQEPLASSTVGRYRNIVDHLQELCKLKLDRNKNNYDDAQQSVLYLLIKIARAFPMDTIAHLDLADSYYTNYETELAKQHYNLYINLMKKNGKQAKIPQRVYERIK